MKADLTFFDAVRGEREQRVPAVPAPDAAGPSGTVTALLTGAGLTMTASGIVAAVLWFVWLLAEIVP